MPNLVDLASIKSSIDDCLDYQSFDNLEMLSIDTRGWDQPYTRFYSVKIKQIPSLKMKQISLKLDYLRYFDLVKYLLDQDFVKICKTIIVKCDKLILPYSALLDPRFERVCGSEYRTEVYIGQKEINYAFQSNNHEGHLLTIKCYRVDFEF